MTPEPVASASSPARATDSASASPAKAIPAARGGPAGDLYIIVHIGEHPVFRRDADDII